MRISGTWSSLILILTLSTVSGCINPDFSRIDTGFLGGIRLELQKSDIVVSSASLASGESVTITVTTRDQNGAIYRSPDPLTVSVSVTGGTSTGTLDQVVDHKDGTYTVNFLGVTAGSALTVSALVSGSPVKSTLPTLTVVSSSIVSSLTFATAPANTGDTDTDLSTQPVIQAKDASGNTVASFGGNISLTGFSDASCVTPVAGGIQASSNPRSAASGQASFSGLRVLKTNVIRIGASDGTHTACSSALTIAAGAPASISVASGNTQTGTVGTTLSSPFVAVVRDANSNAVPGVTVDWLVTGGAGSLSSASSSTNASGLSSTTLTLGSSAGANGASATVNGTAYTITFTATGTPGAVSALSFTTTPSTSGNTDTALPTQPVVSAKDASGNVVTSYGSAITLSAFSGTNCTGSVSGGLTATTNPVTASSGAATFTGLKILKTNVQSIQASDGTRTVCFGTLAISPGAINSISFTTQPAPTTNDTDTAFSTQPVIKAYDANSNLVSNDSASSVALTAYDTAACAGSLVASGLSGTLSQTLSSGIGTFTNIKAVKVAVKAIKATLGAKTACSSTLTINPGAAASMAFTTQPAGGVDTNTNLPTQPVVTVYDASGNVKTDYVSSVTLYANSNSAGCSMVSDVGSGISGNTATASSGVSTYTAARVLKTNAVRLRATDGTLQVCSNTFSITPGVIASLAFSTAPSASTNTDTAFSTQPVVSAFDANSNLVTTNSTASITLTAYSDACTTAVASGLSATANPVTLSSGSATFANLKALKTNIVRLGASDGTRSVCSGAITVSPGVPNSLAVSSGNSPTQTIHYTSALGSPFVVLLKDANLNVIPTTQINWAVTAGGGSLGSGAAVSTDSSGLSSNLLTTGTPGTQTVTATVNGYPALTQTFTATATTSAFTQSWPFDFNTTSSYAYDNTKMDFTGGVCRLTGTDQTDDANDAAGFGGGSLSGVAWDGTNGYLRLNNNGGCDGTVTDCFGTAELDSTWTPYYSNIVFYQKGNGSGNYPTSATANDKGSETCTGPGNTVSYSSSARLKTSLSFSNRSVMSCTASTLKTISNNITIATWIKETTTTASSYASLFYLFDGSTGWQVQRYNLNNSIYLRVDTSGVTNANGALFAAAVLDGTWHHVAFVLASGTIAQYKDGVLVGSGSYTQGGGFGTSSGTFSISGMDTSGTTSLDDLAIWNTNLSANNIAVIYSRQKSRFSGNITSRVMDALSTGQAWTTLSWIPTLPFFKALPDYASSAIQNESSTDYSSLVGSTGSTSDNNLMSGIVGLWHLDEASWNGTIGEVTDSSGNSNNGTAKNGTIPVTNGQFNRAVALDGSTNYIDIADSVSLRPTNQMTLIAWINPKADDGGNIIHHCRSWAPGCVSSGYSAGSYSLAYSGTNSVSFKGYFSPGAHPADFFNVTGSGLIQNTWNLVVGTYDGVAVRIYVNGVLKSSATWAARSFQYESVMESIRIGRGNNDTSTPTFFTGSIDEVGIWNRAVTSAEVLQLYRRGANRVKHQVRVCTAADCSDDATGANWKGPDGTNQTYFSELNNNTVPLAMSGAVKKTLPSMLFSNFTSPVGTSRYFQYRTILESDDTGTGCNYGSGATWCSPELKSVTVDPVHYDTSSPSVIGKTGVSFYSLATFAETLGASCASGIGYNLGVGAAYSSATWYYWNGSAWTTANGTAAQSNAATVIATNAASFSGVAGTGTVYFKAYLKSSGTSKCELDQLDLGGQQ